METKKLCRKRVDMKTKEARARENPKGKVNGTVNATYAEKRTHQSPLPAPMVCPKDPVELVVGHLAIPSLQRKGQRQG